MITELSGPPGGYLFAMPCDWRAEVTAQWEYPAIVDRALGGRETRQSVARSPRLVRYRWRSYAQDAELVRSWWQFIRTDGALVADLWVPWWPGYRAGSEAAVWQADWQIVWGVDGVARIESAEYVASADERVAPAIKCRFERAPGATATTAAVLDLDLMLRETGTASESPKPANAWLPAVGVTLYGVDRPTLPGSPDWAAAQEVGTVSADFDTEEVGDGRAPSVVRYPQAAEHRWELSYSLDAAGAAEMFSCFAQMGVAGTVVAPTYEQVAKLIGPAVAGTPLIIPNLQDALPIGAMGYLGEDGEEAFLVNGLSGPGWLASRALERSWAAGTVVYRALLARWADERFSLSWRSPAVAETRVALIEAAAEYAPATGETTGVTLGAVPETVHLYTITTLSPEPAVARFTSHESDLQGTPGPWTSAPIEHDEIREALGEVSDVTLTVMASVDGLPFAASIYAAPEWAVEVMIEEATLTSDLTVTDPQCLFRGRFAGIETDGPLLQIKCVPRGATLTDRKWPLWLRQPTCSWRLGSAACGKDLESLKSTGAIVSTTLDSVTADLVLPLGYAIDQNWFTGGMILCGMVGGSTQARALAGANALGADRWELLLSHPFTGEVAELVAVYPHCSGDWSRCQAFGNTQRFGGFPTMPSGNPSIPRAPDNRDLK